MAMTLVTLKYQISYANFSNNAGPILKGKQHAHRITIFGHLLISHHIKVASHSAMYRVPD
jgi:hypothetical protein